MPILNITEIIDSLDILLSRYQLQLNQNQMQQLAKDKAARGHTYTPPAMIEAIINAVPLDTFGEAHPDARFKPIFFGYGKEDNRVLYVVLHKNYWTHIPEGDQRWAKLLRKFQEIGRVYEADENYLVPPTDPYTITWRYWWD